MYTLIYSSDVIPWSWALLLVPNHNMKWLHIATTSIRLNELPNSTAQASSLIAARAVHKLYCLPLATGPSLRSMECSNILHCKTSSGRKYRLGLTDNEKLYKYYITGENIVTISYIVFCYLSCRWWYDDDYITTYRHAWTKAMQWLRWLWDSHAITGNVTCYYCLRH